MSSCFLCAIAVDSSCGSYSADIQLPQPVLRRLVKYSEPSNALDLLGDLLGRCCPAVARNMLDAGITVVGKTGVELASAILCAAVQVLGLKPSLSPSQFMAHGRYAARRVGLCAAVVSAAARVELDVR